MRETTLIASMLVGVLAFGQGFNKRFDFLGWGSAQTALGIEVLLDGYLTIGGGTDYDSIAPGVYFTHGSVHLTRLGLNGEVLWEKRAFRPYHSSLPGWSNCCDTIPGGGYVVGGASEDTTGFDEVYLMRFDADGDTLWTRVFGDPDRQQFWIGSQVKRTDSGGFVIVGYTEQGNWDGFAIGTDSSGIELWRRTYGWSSSLSDGLASVAISAQGDLYMSGSRFQANGTGDNWLQRTDSSGLLKWRVSWGGPESEGSCNVTTALDGHALVFSGRGYAPSYAAMRPYLAKIDSSDGTILWEKEYGPSTPFTQFAVGKETTTGSIISAGLSHELPGPSISKGLLALTSSDGDSLWLFKYFYQDDVLDDGTGRFHDVLPTADGGFIAAGAAYFSASGNNPPGISQDTWVVKVDSMGCIVPGCNTVGIAEQATNLLDALTIFPNPASAYVTVRLELPPSVAHLPLQLSVVGMDGRIAQQQTLSGNGDHTLALHGLAAGVYHVHVASEGKWLTGGKLVVE